MNDTATHELMTVSEVALRMRVSAATVRRLIDKGELEAIRFGHQWRIPASALELTDEESNE
jgi:excisionase family DNA binding protein